MLVGQVIGESNAFMSCPVHSSVSGTVAAISELLTAGGKVCKMVEIDTDGDQEVSPDVKPPVITDKGEPLRSRKAVRLLRNGRRRLPDAHKAQL